LTSARIWVSLQDWSSILAYLDPFKVCHSKKEKKEKK
jgi:hypothetical protein